MEKQSLSVKEICEAVSADLKERRITQQKAAEMIGTTKQTVANQLSGKKRFSSNMAQKYCDALGYSIEFLLYGEGPLYAPGRLIWHPRPGTFPELLGRQDDPVMKQSRLLTHAAHILEIMNDKVAIESFEKAVAGEDEEAETLIDILTNRYCYDVPVLLKDPKVTKAFREMREFFRRAEIASAKELVQIEQKAALGELIDVDAEVERFRKRVLWIKDSFKDDAAKAHPDLNLDEYVTPEDRAIIQPVSPDNNTTE